MLPLALIAGYPPTIKTLYHARYLQVILQDQPTVAHQSLEPIAMAV